MKPFLYIQEINGPLLERWGFQDIMPLLDRLELWKKLLTGKGIPKLLVRWVNLMISNFKKKAKRSSLDFPGGRNPWGEISRGYSRSSKDLYDIQKSIETSSESSKVSSILTPCSSASDKANTTGEGFYGYGYAASRPRGNTVSRFGMSQLERQQSSSSTGFKRQKSSSPKRIRKAQESSF